MPPSREQHYVPRWEIPQAPPPLPPRASKPSFVEGADPEAQSEEESSSDSLDRLQKSLIWVAALLIAGSVFVNIRDYFL